MAVVARAVTPVVDVPVSPMPPVEVENDGLLVLFQWLSVKLRPLPEPTKPPKLPPDPPLRVTEPEA